MKCKKTFTLIELIISLALITLIATILTMNGLQMIRKIQGNRQSEQLALILKELELKCLLSKEEAVVTIFQKKDFLEVEIDCASQKKESNLKKKLKITPFLEGYQQELLFHPYKGWDKQLNGNLIELKDKK